MRRIALFAAFILSCTGKAREQRESAKTGDASAAVTRLRAIPVLGARLDGATELLPASLGLAPEKHGTIETLVPLTARAPLRVTRDGTHYLDVAAEHDVDVKGVVDSRAMVFVDASRDTDAFVLAEPHRVEEIRVLRTRAAPTVALYRVKLGPGLASLRARENLVEALDDQGRAWLRTDPIFAVDAGARTATPHALLALFALGALGRLRRRTVR